MEKSGADPSQPSSQESLPGFDSSTPSTEFQDGRSLCGLPDSRPIENAGQRRSPASRFHRPENGKASLISATSGRLFSSSSKSESLGRSLASRLIARMAALGSPEYSLTWKVSDTPSGVPLLTLRASARRISDKDFTGWPTCATRDEKNAGLPESATAREDAGHAQPLTEIAQRARMPLSGWDRTPQASDGDGGVVEIRPGTTGKYKLRDYAHLAGWATASATTRDSKGTDAPNRTGAPSLCEIARGVITELFRVPTGRRAVLAPEFSLWLMGFPEAWVTAAPGAKDWLEAQAALALECSKALETQSSPSLPRSSSSRAKKRAPRA